MHARAALDRQDGIMLVELLVVMVVMTIVVMGLTTSFVSGMHSEVAVSQRQQAQENARLALTRMREDVHCASAIQSVDANDYGGFTLYLSETKGVCPSVVDDDDTDSTTVQLQWCTIPDAARPGTFQLFRKIPVTTPTADPCDGGNSSLRVEYIAAPDTGWPENTLATSATAWDGNIWPTSTCASGLVPTLAVALNVDPGTGADTQGYQLNDRIALRNAARCP